MSETLPYLVRCLHTIGLCEIKVEDFRAAVNGDLQTESKLWRLIHSLVILQICLKGADRVPPLEILHELWKLTPTEIKENERDFLRWQLDLEGFNFTPFYDKQIQSARILLCTIGWLLEKSRTFEVFYAIRDRATYSTLQRSMVPPYPPDTSCEDGNISLARSRSQAQVDDAFQLLEAHSHLSEDDPQNCATKLKMIVHLNGKLDVSLRVMDQLQEEYHRKIDAILQKAVDYDPVHNPKLRHALAFERAASYKPAVRDACQKELDAHAQVMSEQMKDYEMEARVWKFFNHVLDLVEKDGVSQPSKCKYPTFKLQQDTMEVQCQKNERAFKAFQKLVDGLGPSVRKTKEEWSDVKSQLHEKEYEDFLIGMKDIAHEIDSLIPIPDEQDGIFLNRGARC
eukprot:TRINITY_DN4901_c0_g1_i3.p1 TRINITY_DN4901_c0_g1~~TRINITY_DN4901_c0_g1_i3.p1  ORF type:complete len:397 (+),score=87.66 TRINITY_DN4901_c0_g1_i3:76-1266(+)